jgi:tripartite-type tricarboxylate transporter receptor subunit TctC
MRAATRPARIFYLIATFVILLEYLSQWPTATMAQSRAIRLIVPYAPGGGADGVSRILANGLSAQLGRSVVVENRPGGNTIVAAEAVANSEPDGDTLLVSFDETFTVVPILHLAGSFEPDKALTPVSLLGRILTLILVNPAVPVNSLPELIEQARAKPGSFSYASAGTGDGTQLAMEMLKHLANVDILHVPYRGTAPAVAAVAAGDVQLTIAGYATAKGLIDAGRVKPLAVAGPDRLVQLPDLATTKDLGYAKVDATSWLGVVAPANTPPDAIERDRTAFAKVLADEAIRRQLSESRFFEVKDLGPNDFAAQMQERFQLTKEAVAVANVGQP